MSTLPHVLNALLDYYSHRRWMDDYGHRRWMDDYGHSRWMDDYDHSRWMDDYGHRYWMDDYGHSRWMDDLYNQNFGLGLTPHDYLQLAQKPTSSGGKRPWRIMPAGDSDVSSFLSNRNEFKVNLDVQQFKPAELKIKVADGYIVVDGKHKERSDEHGFISRQFTRRYKIPEEVEQEKLSSNLSSDGVLSVSAPKIVEDKALGREIPIVQTNKPAVKLSTPQQLGQKDEEKKEESKMES